MATHDAALRFNLFANDETGKGLHSAAKGFGKLGKSLTAGLAAFGGVSLFKGFIDDARESAKVSRVTANVIKTTGKAAGVTAAQVGDLATSISNKTGADDEAIQSGANMLLTFTGIRNEVGKGNDIFNQATSTVVDMAAAMNNGEVSTSGLKTSSIQLGKALNDPIKGVGALSKVGVTFTEQQKKTIKSLVESGNTMKAQKIILRELGKEFGGTAAAATDPFQKFSTAVGNLREQLGGYLLPTATRLVDWGNKKLLPWIATTADKFVATGKKAAGWAKDLFAQLRGKLPRVDLGKLVHLGTVDTSGIGKNLIAEARGWASDLMDGVQQGFQTGDWSKLGKTIGDGVGAALSTAGGLAEKLFAWIGDEIGKVDWVDLGVKLGKEAPSLLAGLAVGILNFDLGGLLKGLANHWFETILGILTIAFMPAKMAGAIEGLLARVPFGGKLLAWAFTSMRGVSQKLVSLAGEVFAGFGRGALSELGRIFPTLGRFVEGGADSLVRGLLSRAAGFLMVARGWGESLMAGLRSLPGRLGAAGGQWVVRLLEGAVRLSGRLLGWWASLPGAILTAVGSVGLLLYRKGEAILSGLKSGASSAWGGVSGWFAGMGSRVGSAVGDLGSALYQKGIDVVQGFINGIKAKAASLPGVVKDKILSPVNKLLPKDLEIHSPSKLTERYGKYVADGFAKGITGGHKLVTAAARGMADAATSDPKKKAADAKRAAERAKKAREKAKRDAKNLALSYGKSFIAALSGSESRVQSTLDSFIDRMTKTGHKGLATLGKSMEKSLLGLARRRQAIHDKLGDARSNLADRRKAKADYASSILGSFRSDADVTAALDDNAAGGAQGLISRLRQQADHAKAFTAGIAQLRKMKLNKTTLQQLVDAGPEQGLDAVSRLISGGSDAIGQVNSLMGQINAAGKTLGARESSIMYDAGIKTAAGLVKGLESQESAITKAMTKLARSMVRTIRRELGIKSPSRVFHDLGAQVPAGFANGIAAGAGSVNSAVSRMVGTPAAMAGSASGGIPVYVELAWSDGAPREIVRMVRADVRNRGGGNVQKHLSGSAA